MTQISIQAKNQIKVVRLNLQILSEVTGKSASQVPQFKCDQFSIQGAPFKGVKHHTRMKKNINWMDKVIAMLMNANLQRLSVQMIQNQKASWKEEKKN